MFQKPFRVKTQTSIKSSDRKKLRADILKQFSVLTESDVTVLVPNKEEMSITKINTSADENILVYFTGKNPIFFENFKTLYPTVYTLWQYPSLLPVFRTWPPVFEKLQKGADLMLPGVISDKEPSPKMFGNLKKGDLVCISIAGNKSPLALGKALLSGEDMYMSAMRGKGVQVLHIMGDNLWELGDKSRPPLVPEDVPSVDGGDGEGEGTEGQSPPTGDGGLTELADGVVGLEVGGDDKTSDQPVGTAANNESSDVSSEDEEKVEEEDPIDEMDELLHFCFACAIKAKVQKSDLPLLTSHFLRNFMQPYSGGKPMDLKNSSFKKLSKFLQSKVKDGYIKMKEQTKGVDVITEVDKSHPELRDVVVPEIEEETKKPGQTEDTAFTPLQFTDVYLVNAATLDLFKDAKLGKGDALLMSDVRQLVTDYIKANNLQREERGKSVSVTLDPVLAHIILKPSEGDLDHMSWEQVINRVVGKMQAAVAISLGSGPPTIKKGKLDPIKLDVAMRASQKKVTIVDNLEEFGIDLKTFAQVVQKAVACSCSVVASEQKNKGPQVVVQGNQINFVYTLLTEKYKIPKRLITGIELAPKQKKKR
ncbi:eukaryotic translation initiation factor 2D-like [Physella acuta]|uniref:eukaryotic translation initiation factor 2D-like n=1 Tax=Physella acuta TaxID=109671 RepID=UPI0027DE60FB|nr:eukaryotic translation initiation factor 2D-like [Physella acuta]XP_059175629.1 eukaryotic translation initiation factor 2D-like [Physella acuta]XP_059175630.1 eukaryotic translation initiation factor 2D-like [Physella acuta]XP_059175631.1 eukaryotic translation initiation factor 2D-like [Physella acuta]